MKNFSFIILLMCSLQSVTLLAQEHIHLNFKEVNKSSNNRSMAITWTSEKPCMGTIKYGIDSNNLNLKLDVKAMTVAGHPKLFSYKALLQNLKPATKYYYQCNNDANCSNGIPVWSHIYSFTTTPKQGKIDRFTVGVWGDTQNNEGNRSFEQTEKIVNQLLKYPLNFTLHTGDIVENGSVPASWDGFLKTAEPLNARFPFMPATGNHDVVNANTDENFQKPFPIFYDLFNLPGDQLNYSYDYGNVHFIAINSGYCQGAAKVGKVLFKIGSPEYQWLEGDLKQARKNKKIKWIILYDHYPMYSYGVSLVKEWQNQLTPIIDKYKVDLVLSGHRHVYERHAAIRLGAIEKPTNIHHYEKPNGTVYITNGSAGGSLQGIGGKDMPSMLFTAPQKMYTYAIMSIENRSLTYDVYDQNGEKIDYFQINK